MRRSSDRAATCAYPYPLSIQNRFVLVMRLIVFVVEGGQQGNNNSMEIIKLHRVRRRPYSYLPIPVPTERPFLHIVWFPTEGKFSSSKTTIMVTGTEKGTAMTTTTAKAAPTGMKIGRRFGDYDDHKNGNDDGHPLHHACTFRLSLDLPDMSDIESP